MEFIGALQWLIIPFFLPVAALFVANIFAKDGVWTKVLYYTITIVLTVLDTIFIELQCGDECYSPALWVVWGTILISFLFGAIAYKGIVKSRNESNNTLFSVTVFLWSLFFLFLTGVAYIFITH